MSEIASGPSAAHQPRDDAGITLYEQGRHAEALAEVDALLAAHPALAGCHNTRGLILAALGDAAGAKGAYDRALALAPGFAEALSNRGTARLRLGQVEAAMSDLRAAVAMRPDLSVAHFNLGRAFAAQNMLGVAIACYDHALTLSPGDAKVLWAKGVAEILAGDYAAGWANYRWRWQAPGFGQGARDFGVPRYTGAEPLTGRTLFVHAEQGFGDTIQFCRYIPPVAALAKRVLFMVQPELERLLKASQLPCELFVPGAAMPRFDYDVPLMDLPAALNTTVDTVPADVPYLVPPADKAALWQSLLGESRRPRIGLAWSGRRSHADDHLRSLAVEMLAPLFEQNAEFHVIQTDMTDAERRFLTDRARMFDVPNRDFADAAAHVAAMDLVITVDTSIAHLAGALGKPVWILLQYSPDFRWLLERPDSPWYPTARLFRQIRAGDWADVVAAVAAAVNARLGQGGAH